MRRSRKANLTRISFLLALLLAFSVLLPAAPARAVSQSDIDALEAQKAALEAKAQAQQATIDELNSSKALFIDRKAALDTQIQLNRQEIELINDQIQLYDELISQKESELESAMADEERQTELLRTRMRAMEENGTLSYVSILFEANSFTDLLSRIADITDIMHYDKTLEESYMSTREDVESIKTGYEETQLEQEALKKELDSKKAQLDSQTEAACNMIANLDELSENAEADYAAIAADEDRVTAEITELMQKLAEEEAAARVAAAAAAAAAASQPASGSTTTGNTANGNSTAGGAASGSTAGSTDGSASTGGSTGNDASGGSSSGSSGSDSGIVSLSNLLWPLPSSHLITSRFGNRVSPTAGASSYHQGIDINGAEGAVILATASGTVEIAEYSSGYGNYVFINHGDGIGSLYAHMSSMAVSYGQYVTQGQVIGYVGTTGIVTGAHLHFEIWVNGGRTDPTAYFTGYTFWNC